LECTQCGSMNCIYSKSNSAWICRDCGAVFDEFMSGKNEDISITVKNNVKTVKKGVKKPVKDKTLKKTLKKTVKKIVKSKTKAVKKKK